MSILYQVFSCNESRMLKKYKRLKIVKWVIENIKFW